MGDKTADLLNPPGSRVVAHPDSPAGGVGPGHARPPGAAGKGTSQSSIPHPNSPAGRLFPWKVELPAAGGSDPSFQFSFTRQGGLTPRESALLQQAHTYFQLQMGSDGKIAGVLILPNGSVYALVSGKHGGPHGGTQNGFIPRGKGSGVTRYNVTHIEGHTAAILNRAAVEAIQKEKVGEAALLIPKQPCGACDPNIPKMLPSGTRLFVVDPEATTVYQSTSGLAVTGAKFARRPEELHFKVPKGSLRIRAAGRFMGQTLGSVALSLLLAWLRGKLEQKFIDKQIKELEPEINKALQNNVDQILAIIDKRQKPYANVTVEISSITNLAPGESGPEQETSFPGVKLKSVRVSDKEINRSEPEQCDRHVFYRVNTTQVTFSFEVGL